VTADVRSRLAALLAEVLQIEVPDGADVRRGGLDAWDSVNHFRLVMEVEQAFGVALSDDEVTDVDSLSGLEAVVARKLDGRGAA
jgi:acyl carrier protein